MEEEIHGYADWDGTTIRQHSNLALHLLGVRYNKLRAPTLGYWAMRFWYNERRGKDTTREMHGMATVLRSLPFSATDDITTKLQVNPGIEIVRRKLPDYNPVNLVIITKNDTAFVWAGVNQLEQDLLQYGILIVDVQGNIYGKNRDGTYTGEVQLLVGNKLGFIEDGKPFFGDKQDRIRCRDYPGFILVPEL